MTTAFAARAERLDLSVGIRSQFVPDRPVRRTVLVLLSLFIAPVPST